MTNDPRLNVTKTNVTRTIFKLVQDNIQILVKMELVIAEIFHCIGTGTYAAWTNIGVTIHSHGITKQASNFGNLGQVLISNKKNMFGIVQTSDVQNK